MCKLNYRFITKLHNLSLNTVMENGTKINDFLKISNSSRNIDELFDNRLFRSCIGEINYNDIGDGVYIYAVGSIKDLLGEIRDDYNANNYLDILLRAAQDFVNSLWLIKDNSVFIKDGYLQMYHKGDIFGSNVVSNSLSLMPVTASCQMENIVFSREEIISAREIFNENPFDVKNLTKEQLQFPSKNPLTKTSGRIGRANYFTTIARDTKSLPIKILNYCTALECLFTSDNSEVTHKISERLARYLGADLQQRKEFFQLVKDAYKIRSKAIHGQAIKDNKENMIRISVGLDDTLRNIFITYYSSEEKSKVFDIMNNTDYEDWFTELILN